MADHYYHPDGKMESTDLRTARKKKLFPSVTKILGLVADDFSYWRESNAIQKAIEFSLENDRPLIPKDEIAIRGRVQDELGIIRTLGNTVHAAMDHCVKHWELPPSSSMLYSPHACWWRSAEQWLGVVTLMERAHVRGEAQVASERLKIGGTVDFHGHLLHDFELTHLPPRSRGGREIVIPAGCKVVIDHKTQRLGKDGKPSFDWRWCMQLAAYSRILNCPGAVCISHIIPIHDTVRGSFWRVWTAEDLDRGWLEFSHLLNYWHTANGF